MPINGNETMSLFKLIMWKACPITQNVWKFFLNRFIVSGNNKSQFYDQHTPKKQDSKKKFKEHDNADMTNLPNDIPPKKKSTKKHTILLE